MTPRTVHLWTNGMVTVFDALGQQIPALQGPAAVVAAAVAAAADPLTAFWHSDWNAGLTVQLTRQEWLIACDLVGVGW